MAQRPSEKLDDLLMCRVAWEDADAPIRSWAMLFIYEAACEVLALNTQDDRRKMLTQIPEVMRERVKDEALRIHYMRKGA